MCDLCHSFPCMAGCPNEPESKVVDTCPICDQDITFRGEVQNPRLIMGDAYVKVLDTFVSGDVLVIDASDKSLTKNGENIDTQLEKGSKWAYLTFDVGENLLSYDADSGNNLMMVRVYFNKRYLGV